MGSGAHGFTNVKSNPTHAHMHSYRHTHSHTHTHSLTYTLTHTHVHRTALSNNNHPLGVCGKERKSPFPSLSHAASLTWPLTLLVSLSLSLHASLQVFLFRRSCRVNPCACASTCVNVCVGTRVALSTVLRALPLLLHASPPLPPISPSSPRSLGCFCSLRF